MLKRAQPLVTRRWHSKLSRSAEAVRQTQMGRALDPASPVAPETPILEEIFNDREIFARDGDYLVEDRFPTPNTPLASSPPQIKGCMAGAVSALFSHQVLAQCRTRLTVPQLASLFFFPPWHPIAQYRKSRPALVIIPRAGLDYNGNVPAEYGAGTGKGGATRKKMSMALKPLDMAVWRQETGRRFRAALFEQFAPGRRAVDGLYVVMPRRVPTRDEARRVVGQFTEAVSQADLDWASKPTQAGGGLGYLKHQMIQRHVRPPGMFLERRMWSM